MDLITFLRTKGAALEALSITLFIIGAILILLELITPGGISFCVGLSSISIGLAYQFQWITSLYDGFVWWIILSILSSFIGIFATRAFFSGTQIKGVYDEDKDAFGTHVKVVTDFKEQTGEIFYSGTNWIATTEDASGITKGDVVEIIDRQNITWVVKKIK